MGGRGGYFLGRWSGNSRLTGSLSPQNIRNSACGLAHSSGKVFVSNHFISVFTGERQRERERVRVRERNIEH